MTMYKRSPAIEEENPRSALWLVTFTDIMALMLTFFVLLYSMAVPNEDKWLKMSSAINVGFNKFESPKFYAGEQDTISIDKIDTSRALDLRYLASLMRALVEQEEVLKGAVITPNFDHVIISLPANLLFEPGKMDVSLAGRKALFALGGSLSRIRNRVEITGHAAPGEESATGADEIFDLWSLSLKRAAGVAAVLENVGYERDLTIRGLSNGAYEYLPTALSAGEKAMLARRVDIMILKDEGRGVVKGLFQITE